MSRLLLTFAALATFGAAAGSGPLPAGTPARTEVVAPRSPAAAPKSALPPALAPTTAPPTSTVPPTTIPPATSLPPATTPPLDPCAAMQAAVALPPPAGWAVRCAGARPGLMGEMETSTLEIIVYLRPAWSVATAARVFAHELGHAYDWSTLTDGDRASWMARRGIDGAWPDLCDQDRPCGDLATPAGDWAESFGEWLVPSTGLWAGELGPPPDAMDLDVMRAILANRGVPV